MDHELERISKSLSYFLRHSPDYIDRKGWANTENILAVLGSQYPQVTSQLLERIVAEDPKGRYLFSPDRSRIMAAYGHSVPLLDLELERPDPADIPAELFHGTSRRFLSSIMAQGLLPMSRNFVHLSTDPATARIVGRRHGKPVAILRLDARAFAAAGHDLFRAENGIWVAPAVPPDFFRVQDPE